MEGFGVMAAACYQLSGVGDLPVRPFPALPQDR